MKKIILTAVVLCFLSGNLLKAQDEEIGMISKFGLGIGLNAIWLVPDLSALNNMLPGTGVGSFSDAGFVALGGSGYFYLTGIDNVRVGLIGFSGSAKQSGSQGGFNKEVDYSLGLGGISVEYTIPFFEKVGVSVGGIIGIGSSSITIYQNAGDFTWDGVWNEVSNSSVSTKNISRKISNTFFTLTPTINVDIPLSRFALFRIGTGYMISLSNNWKGDNDVAISGVPSSLNGSSFFIQAGLMVGFISF